MTPFRSRKVKHLPGMGNFGATQLACFTGTLTVQQTIIVLSSSFILPKAAHNTKNTQNTVIIHVEPKNLKKRNNKWQGTDRQTDDLMQSTIYRHSVTLFYTLTEMCPAVTDLITKLFQIHDFISCCDDERDNKLYFASKDNTRHCLVVQSKACRIVLELFIIRL